MLLSGSGFSPWVLGSAPPAAGTVVAAVAPKNAPPTVAQTITINNHAAVTGTTATLSVLGSDPGGQKLTYTWSVTSAPSGAAATFSVNGSSTANYTTVAFSKAGTYGVAVTIQDTGGLTVSTTANVVVTPTLTYFSIAHIGGTGDVQGTTVQFSVSQCQDQFHNALGGTPALTWAAPSLPSGAATPSFATNGSVTTVTFKMAGYYSLTARAPNAAGGVYATSLTVDQMFTSVALAPNALSVLLGATQQFTPLALDQFCQPLANQQMFNWTASAGTISGTGMFTAPSSGSNCTVTAKIGLLAGVATVTLLANPGKLQDAALAALVAKLDADGSISRQDMIQILNTVAGNGPLGATDFSDLKEILYQSATLKTPGYVQVLAADVINGNLANATYQGQPLGNLAAGSSAAQLTKLINKWFYGTDRPAICNSSLVYQSVAGSLFPHVPSHADEYQGQLGDCYFISALGTLADSNPAAVENMFINNNDGTYTVRFYTGTYGTIYNYNDGSIGAGFRNSLVTADYVTVDCMLPVSSTGKLGYADYGVNASNTGNSLWIALAEKAYAQWNQSGRAGRDDQNAYASIEGGWMATVDAQVLGYNATDYIMSTTSEQTAISALAAHQAVTIGTGSWSGSGTQYGLYQNHAYAIIGYNASSDTFTLYNPWGNCQPGQLTWSQLRATCTQLAVANTSGSVAIASAQSSPAVHSRQVGAGLAHGVLSAPLLDALLAAGGRLW
jgi:hypothetical protein